MDNKLIFSLVLTTLLATLLQAADADKPYLIKKAPAQPTLEGSWDAPAWADANILTLDNFVKRSSDHHPKVQVKLTYTDKGLFVFFRVFDKYVRCTRTDYQASVCGDSCVEFFVRPLKDKGYFNFEINCGGTMLLYYIEDPTSGPDGFKKYTRVPRRLGKMVRIYHSMAEIVYPEIEKDTEWTVEYYIPFALFEEYVGSLGKISGQIWQANFYKCADNTSHPHWASWASLQGKLSFHLPEYFAPLRFE